MTAGGKKFAYSRDSGIIEQVRALCQDADLPLHRCYRGSGEQVHPALKTMSPDPGEIARMAEQAGVKRLLLTHFRIHMDRDEVHQAVHDDPAAHFSSPAETVEDLQEYVV